MANNVNIVLERDIKGTNHEKYSIYVNNEKYVTGWIKPWDYNWNKYRTGYHYLTNTEMLERIKEMYYWLF